MIGFPVVLKCVRIYIEEGSCYSQAAILHSHFSRKNASQWPRYESHREVSLNKDAPPWTLNTEARVIFVLIFFSWFTCEVN